MPHFQAIARGVFVLVVTLFTSTSIWALTPARPHPWAHSPIHKAVFDCATSILKDLIEKGADINAPSNGPSKQAVTALALAFEMYQQTSIRPECPRIELLKELLVRGATLGGKSLRDAAIPTTFATSGNPEELRLLMSYGMRFTENPKTDGKLLTTAVSAGNLNLVSELLALGISSNAIDASGCSSLYRATLTPATTRRTIFETLLAANADPNMQCGNDSPLHRLSSFPAPNDKELIILLLKHRADPNLGLKTSENRTPLENLVQSSSSTREIADMLVSSGAKLTPLLGPLVASSYNRTAPVWVDFLADHGFDMNYIDNRRGGTLLMMAFKSGHIQTAKALLRRGSNPKLQWNIPVSTTHSTAFTLSILHQLPPNERETLQALEILLPYGLDVNARGDRGSTPLLSLTTSSSPQPKSIALLLNSGADVHAVDQNGRGVVHRLAANTNTSETSPLTVESLRIVVKKGADINLQDRFGNAPIMSAARWTTPTLVAEFIELGAKIHIQNQHGLTPLHVAAFKGSSGMVSLLLKKGADKNALSEIGERPCDIASLGRFAIDDDRIETLRLLCPPDQAKNWQPPPLKNQAERQELDQRAHRFNVF